MSHRSSVYDPIVLFVACLSVLCVAGCEPMVGYIATAKEVGSPAHGKTYYVGGAGPIGNVGSWDVPTGLSEGGYSGAVEVFPWQSMTHTGDQINLSRNREKAMDLANRIKAYRRVYRDTPVNIIALSAGTGVATFALEFLPEGTGIDQVIFLGCSLSSHYDMTRALRRVNKGLYAIHSPYDRILRNVVWYTGTVDRSSAENGVVGLDGFFPPPRAGDDTEAQYAKIRNVPYRPVFAEAGYGGGHTEGTRSAFVRHYLAPVLLGDDSGLLGRAGAASQGERLESEFGVASQPSSRPSEMDSSDTD